MELALFPSVVKTDQEAYLGYDKTVRAVVSEVHRSVIFKISCTGLCIRMEDVAFLTIT